MNKITVPLLIIVMALCFFLGTTRQSKALDRNFVGILPFVTSNDRVGFLNQNNGRVYIYDSNISQCLFIGQIQNLGDPIQVISNTPVNTQNK